MEIVHTDKAPAAIGPYSQAVKANGMLFVSGQIGINPADQQLTGDVVQQAEQALKNMEAILLQAGSSFGQVVKTTVLLVDMEDFAKINAVYDRAFAVTKPARACFAVKALPKGALFEIEAVALA